MRTTTSLIAISITLGDSGAAGGDDGAAAHVATTTGANAPTRPADAPSPAGNLDPPPLRATALPAGSRARASRRQPNSCCGLSPCRRATSDTLAPGPRLSTTMRALSSSDHRRRRPVPVISSIRRTDATASSVPPSGLLSTLCSSVWSNRSLMARHQATDHAPPKCGVRAPLTQEHPRPRPRRRVAWRNGDIDIRTGAKLLVLSQRPYLPIGALRRAVTYPNAAESRSVEQIAKVLAKVELGHLVARLDEDGSRDQTLSGGEKQRLAFARILLHRPDIIVLDEATATLDSASQDPLQASDVA
jgi:ABC-type sugar transport system ATPase subunit